MAAGMASSGVLTEIRKRAEEASIPVKVVPRTEIDRLAEGENHQGVVAVTGRFRYAALEDLFGEGTCLVFLDGVTDPHNLGSLIRTAECCGFAGIVIPTHRSVAVTSTVRRVAAGAAEVLPVARVTNLGRSLDQAKAAGVWIVGLDGEAEGVFIAVENINRYIQSQHPRFIGFETKMFLKPGRSDTEIIFPYPIVVARLDLTQ